MSGKVESVTTREPIPMDPATLQSCRALAEVLGSVGGGGEMRNFGGVLVFVPEAVPQERLEAAAEYLRLQMAVRDQADQGGT